MRGPDDIVLRPPRLKTWETGTVETSTARVPTGKAARYLVQLCKHFGHRVPAEWSETDGLVRFEPGTCRMSARDDALSLACESATAEDLAVVEAVVADHLLRFAWKEDLAVEWEKPAATS
jgi:uncharacterized protein